jgi:iron complex outermembrane receptor protein
MAAATAPEYFTPRIMFANGGLMFAWGRRIGALAFTTLMMPAASIGAYAQEETDPVSLPKIEVTTKQSAAKKKKAPAQTSAPSQTSPEPQAETLPATEETGSASDAIRAHAQRAPASISVLTRDEITDAGIGSVQDAGRRIPNVILSDQGSPRFTVNAIRGIGSTVRDDYFNTSLGIYIDGVPATTAEFSRRLGDVESVEVLRGPQGTLFGPNTPAGVVNITSRASTDIFAAEVQGTIGNNGQRGTSAFMSGPIAGKALAGRMFFDYVARDGFTDYASSGKSIDDLEAATGSGSIQFRPNERLTATISGSLEHTDQGAYAYQPFDAFKRRVVDITPPNEEVRDSGALAANVSYDFGAVKLRSISGYRAYDVRSEQDLSYNQMLASFGGGRASADEDGKQLSQELRLTGRLDPVFNWVAGAFYQNTTFDYAYLFDVRVRRCVADDIRLRASGACRLWRGHAHRCTRPRSHRRRARHAGAARDRNRRGFRRGGNLHACHAEARGRLSPGQRPADLRLGDPRRPFRRLQPALELGAREEYDPESLWSYEAGLKSEWFARTLTFNAAVFYIDWTDQQIRTQVAPGSVLIDNAGRSFSEGFELEASWRPVQGLELSGFLGVTHGEYEKYVDRFGVDLAGNTLVNTPELTAGLIAQYRWPIANSPFVGLVRGEYLYTGDQYFDAENRLEQDGYGLVNLRAGIETDTFSAVVFAKNLFDQDYRVYGYRDFEGSMLASDIAVAGESRLVGVTATWRY